MSGQLRTWLQERLLNFRLFHVLLVSKLGLEGETHTGLLVYGRRTSTHSPIELWPERRNILSRLFLSTEIQFKFLLAEGSRGPHCSPIKTGAIVQAPSLQPAVGTYTGLSKGEFSYLNLFLWVATGPPEREA